MVVETGGTMGGGIDMIGEVKGSQGAGAEAVGDVGDAWVSEAEEGLTGISMSSPKLLNSLVSSLLLLLSLMVEKRASHNQPAKRREEGRQ